MTSLIDLGREWFREANTLPDVVAGRCVHTLLETATCQACADVCPREAWLIDDEQLGIDVNRCDGCRLCVAACPQGAIQAAVTPLIKTHGGNGIAMLACQPSGAHAADGVVPCIHALSLTSLMGLYRQGVRTLLSCSAHCDGCERGKAPRLDDQITHLNMLLDARGLPAIRHETQTPAEWSRRAVPQPGDAAAGPSMSRRQFFRRAGRDVLSGQQQLSTMDAAAATGYEPPGRLLPRHPAAQMAVVSPQINGVRCNACDACAQLCPHEAIDLQLDEQGNGSAYRIMPDACSGCGICVDVCDQGAVTLHHWAVPTQEQLELANHNCRACGSPYRLPAGRKTEQQLCWICARTNHHRLLFQVLE